jgi:hypothetical protein
MYLECCMTIKSQYVVIPKHWNEIYEFSCIFLVLMVGRDRDSTRCVTRFELKWTGR